MPYAAHAREVESCSPNLSTRRSSARSGRRRPPTPVERGKAAAFNSLHKRLLTAYNRAPGLREKHRRLLFEMLTGAGLSESRRHFYETGDLESFVGGKALGLALDGISRGRIGQLRGELCRMGVLEPVDVKGGRGVAGRYRHSLSWLVAAEAEMRARGLKLTRWKPIASVPKSDRPHGAITSLSAIGSSLPAREPMASAERESETEACPPAPLRSAPLAGLATLRGAPVECEADSDRRSAPPSPASSPPPEAELCPPLEPHEALPEFLDELPETPPPAPPPRSKAESDAMFARAQDAVRRLEAACMVRPPARKAPRYLRDGPGDEWQQEARP